MSTTIYTSNGKILINGSNNKWLSAPAVVPFGPNHITLDSGVVRVRVTPGSVPAEAGGPPDTLSVTHVEGDVWDVVNTNSWSYAFQYSNLLTIAVDILDFHIPDGVSQLESVGVKFDSNWTNLKRINISYGADITKFYETFTSSSIEEIYLSNMPSLYEITNMCKNASGLKMVPYIDDVSGIRNCLNAFEGCVNVESGITNMYNRLSQVSALSEEYVHYKCFYQCGSNTVAGAAELANVPSSWGGTAS